MKNTEKNDTFDDLLETLVSIKNKATMAKFLKDLCTPQEINALSERWRVCQLLHQGELSYREIHALTGASLATITRVARFLKDEPHRGYQAVLEKNS
jgi:TrpR-related protein YerC/YecD